MKNLLLFCLAACGGGSDDTMTGVDAAGNEPMINGKPASQYYAQFTHATTKTNVEGAAAFPAQADGRDAFVAHVFLMPDNKLVLFYGEGDGSVSPTGYSINVIRSSMRRREGTWRVDGAQLVLDAFMRCDGLTVNNKDALRCTLATSIVTAAAQGRAGTLQVSLGTSSPDDSAFADYVP